MSSGKIVIFVLLVLLNTSCSERKSPILLQNTIIGKKCESPRSFTFVVNKQDGKKESGYIEVLIDKVLIVNESYSAKQQYFQKEFTIQICDGKHTMEVETEEIGSKEYFHFNMDENVEQGLLAFKLSDSHGDDSKMLFSLDLKEVNPMGSSPAKSAHTR